MIEIFSTIFIDVPKGMRERSNRVLERARESDFPLGVSGLSLKKPDSYWRSHIPIQVTQWLKKPEAW